MSTAVKDANDVLAFLLELVVYASACYWGATLRRGWPIRVLAGLGAPAVLIAVWSLFGAPTAIHPVHGIARAALEICWYGAGAAAITATQGRRWAAAFVIAYLISTAILYL
jgi:hypothetical protein